MPFSAPIREATGDVVLDGVSHGAASIRALRFKCRASALVPEDRLGQGLVPEFEIWRNTTLPALKRCFRLANFAVPVAAREYEREAGKPSSKPADQRPVHPISW